MSGFVRSTEGGARVPESVYQSIRVSSRVKRKAFQQGETRIEQNTHIRYARLPWSVLTDRTLSSDAKVVYGIMAGHVFQGNVAYIGQRLIADLSGFSPAKVNRLLKKLAQYIDVRTDGPGRRSFYVLKSPVFGQKQGKEDVIVNGPRGKRLASVDARKSA